MFKVISCGQISKENQLSNMKNITEELYNIIAEKRELVTSLQCLNGAVDENNLVLLEGDVLFNIARKSWRQVEDAILEESAFVNHNIANTGTQITRLLQMCCDLLLSCENEQQKDIFKTQLSRYVGLLQTTILPIRSINVALLVKLTPTTIEDDSSHLSKYFHMYFSINWLLVTLDWICSKSVDNFENLCECLFKDLIAVSEILYNKHKAGEILNVNPFICPCIKTYWVLIQFLIKQLNSDLLFWTMFNKSCEQLEDVAVLWLLYHVGMSQGLNSSGEYVGLQNDLVCENYSLIESRLNALLRTVVTSTNVNKDLLTAFKLAEPLVNHWWVETVRSEPYQIMWEFFNKHINVNLGVEEKVPRTAIEITELVQRILLNDGINDAFEYFLYMLNKHLTNSPNQWSRIKGRIYSKLPAHKINDLTDWGIYRIIILFLSLANSVNVVELTGKLNLLLENLSQERKSKILIWNTHISIVMLHLKGGIGIEKVVIPLMALVRNAADSRSSFYKIKLFIDSIDGVLICSENLGLQQHLLLENWAKDYLLHCSHSYLCCFLNVLMCCVKRVKKSGDAWQVWEQQFQKFVLPELKQLATSSVAPYQVGELAALVVQENESLMFESILFFAGDTIAPKIVYHFLCTLLGNVDTSYGLPRIQEIAILQGWIRCYLLNIDGSKNLTNLVAKLHMMHSLLENHQSCVDFPIIIKMMNKKMTLQRNNPQLKELCFVCFGNVDRWAVKFLLSSSSEAETLHMYTCVSLLIFHCSTLLYYKSKSSCLLSKLIGLFLLPTDVLMGKPPHPHIIFAVHRTWHLFAQGIFALDYNCDPYLERTLRDLIVRYFLHLPLKDSPIIKCLQSEHMAAFILEKISAAYLTSRTGDENTTKALKFLLIAVQTANSFRKLEIIVQKTFRPTLEVVMFHSTKTTAIEIIKYLSNCGYYGELRSTLQKEVIAVTEKHLAFDTNNYFHLIRLLIKFIPADVRLLFASIKEHVMVVERRRGLGFDNTLRQALDNVETLLK